MQPINQYLTGQAESVALVELNRLVARYEWFTAARRARALLYGVTDRRLVLPMLFSPTVPPSDYQFGRAHNRSLPNEIRSAELAEDAIIDRFLEQKNLRIVPDNTEAEMADALLDDVLGATGEDFVTEELAEIYRAQGLYGQAREIYRRLSLLNPEKSIYFADVIAQIEREITN